MENHWKRFGWFWGESVPFWVKSRHSQIANYSFTYNRTIRVFCITRIFPYWASQWPHDTSLIFPNFCKTHRNNNAMGMQGDRDAGLYSSLTTININPDHPLHLSRQVYWACSQMHVFCNMRSSPLISTEQVGVILRITEKGAEPEGQHALKLYPM